MASPDPATLDLLYFAWVREAVGCDGETIPHPGSATRIVDLIADLCARDAGHAAAFARPERLRAALDQRFVPLEAAIGDARELALFPPVTGG